MMTIKNKLMTLIVIILVSIGSMYGLLHFALPNVSSLKDSEKKVSELEVHMLLLRRNEKDFLARDDLKYVTKFDKNVANFKQTLTQLEDDLDRFKISHSKIKALDNVLESYKNKFHQLATLRQKIGLSPKEGLRGSLRSAVHKAESRVKELGNYQLLSGILQLRRNEKDFLLRKDLKYKAKFENNFQALLKNTEAAIDDNRYLMETTKLLNIYREGFLDLVTNYEEHGLTSKDGLLGQMRKTIHASETLLSEQRKEITQRLDTEINSIFLYSSIKAITIAAVVSALAFFIARNILTCIIKLRDVMKSSKENKDLTIRYDVVSKDELSDMGDNFNSMMTEFQSLINDVSKSSIQLSAAAEQVSSIARDTASGLEQQKGEVVQVSSAIQQMENAMHQVFRSTENTSQTAKNSQSRASEGQNIIGLTVENINNLANDASETSDVVTKLAETSAKINTVLDVIKGIAEQTNLLALNASIEAARAGTHGRGFSVVADEVRGLASRTQESATEIEVMINELQLRTKEVSNKMLNSVELSNSSAEEASSAIGALDQILKDAIEIVDMTTSVASAVEEQADIAGTINTNAEHIQKIVDVANEQVSQNAVASEEVAKQAHHLQSIVRIFKV